MRQLNSEEAASRKIFEICQEQQVTCIALANLTETFSQQIENYCNQLKIQKEPCPAESLPLAMDEAGVGVTGIEFASAAFSGLIPRE